MRRINPRGLLALENEELVHETPPAVELPKETELHDIPEDDHPVAPEHLAAVDAVETDLAESSEFSAEVEGVQEDTDEAMEVATALESIHHVLQGTLREGGLTRGDAAPVKLALESLTDTVGMQPVAFPKLELFDSVSGRLRGTQMAMEGIVEGAKKLWDHIISAVTAAIKWLSERFQMFWYNSDKISKRADELITAANKTKGEAKSGEFDSADLIKKLHIGGKLQVLSSAARLHEVAGKVFSAKADVLAQVNKSMSAGAPLGAPEVFTKLMDELGVTAKVTSPKEEGLAVAEGCELRRQAELPGGKTLLAQLPSDSVTSAPIEKMTCVLADYAPRTTVSEEQKLNVLKPSEVEELCNEVKKVCELVSGFKKSIEAVNGAKKMIVASAKNLAKNPGEGDVAKQNREKAREALWMVNLHDQPAAGFTLYTLKTCVSLLDYGTQSLKQYAGNDKGVAATAGTGTTKKEEPAAVEPKKADTAPPAAPAANDGEKKDGDGKDAAAA